MYYLVKLNSTGFIEDTGTYNAFSWHPTILDVCDHTAGKVPRPSKSTRGSLCTKHTCIHLSIQTSFRLDTNDLITESIPLSNTASTIRKLPHKLLLYKINHFNAITVTITFIFFIYFITRCFFLAVWTRHGGTWIETILLFCMRHYFHWSELVIL